MRKDAERNRDRLIAAASEIMRAEGDVPMEAIAERAGVTRGTLYRNFAHRQEMYEAVLERDLENLATLIAADQKDNPLAFIRHTAELMMVYDRFLGQLVDMDDYDAATNQFRMAQVLAAPLKAAQKQGILRSDLTSSEVLMACRMLASNWKLDDQTDFETAFGHRFALLTRGMNVVRNDGARRVVDIRERPDLPEVDTGI